MIKNKMLLFVLIILGASFACTLPGNNTAQKLSTTPDLSLSISPTEVHPTAAQTDLCLRSAEVLLNPGGRVDWSAALNILAYDAPGPVGYYEVYSMLPDGSKPTCVTCNIPELPKFHKGNPSWSPDGRYIVFQAVDPNLYQQLPQREMDKREITEPGVGIAQNLWIYDRSARRFYQLTDIARETGIQGGVLNPNFSPDGKLLSWAERVASNTKDDPDGEWVIRLASFSARDGQPRLDDIQTFQPGFGKKRLYETHGFSPDGQQIIYTANPDGQNRYGYDIYLYNWKIGKITRLTQTPRVWDEHAHFTPDGEHIVWMSSLGQNPNSRKVATELWIMKVDGSGVHQLSSFNDPASPYYLKQPDGVVIGDVSFSPDGRRMAVYVIINQRGSRVGSPGELLMVSFGCTE